MRNGRHSPIVTTVASSRDNLKISLFTTRGDIGDVKNVPKATHSAIQIFHTATPNRVVAIIASGRETAYNSGTA